MTFLTFSLGCKVNSYECSAISANLINHDFKEVKDNPDIVIINTCSVTATADQKSRQHIRKFIKMYPSAISVVMGCYAQGNAEYIFNEIKPTILIGTSYRNEIYELINQYLETKERICKIDSNPRLYNYEELGLASYSENVRAYLKIQDGCNNFCSYCLIPYRRGKMRSREEKYILEEAKLLVLKGYKEIVLTGIHVGGYGQDLENTSFSSLVEKLCDIPNLYRLRISSIEESEIDEKLINLLKTKDNLAKHLHIPLQSGSSSVLKRMNRKYDASQFIEKLNYIRKEIPHIALSSDVIVGFPGESDEEFLETIETIKKCDFNMLHVFPYSAREGTVAAKMPNQVDPRIKNERAKQLINLSTKLWDDYKNKFVGTSMDVLVEQYDAKKHLNFGHTSNYLEVSFNDNEEKIGKIVNVKI